MRRAKISVEENKELARHLEEEIQNQQKLEVIDEIIAPEYINNGPNGSHTFTGEGLKDYYRGLFAAIPDFHDEVHQMVAEGSIVVVRATRSGTFKGKWGKREPTGIHASFSAFNIFRVEDGRIAECWWLTDTVEVQKWAGTYGKE